MKLSALLSRPVLALAAAFLLTFGLYATADASFAAYAADTLRNAAQRTGQAAERTLDYAAGLAGELTRLTVAVFAPANQPASAAAAAAHEAEFPEIESQEPEEDAAGRATLAQAETAQPQQPTIVENTTIEQPVIERTVERVIEQPPEDTVSYGALAALLRTLREDLIERINEHPPLVFSGPAETTPATVAMVANTNKIDQLTNTIINTPIITGGTMSDVSSLSVSGNLTVSGAQTLSGALTVPYITATSTTATSTFAGPVTIQNLTAGTGSGGDTTNTAFGRDALAANTTGVRNTAIGQRALTSNTSGVHNTAVGRALEANTTGSENIGVGRIPLLRNTIGRWNIAVGNQALQASVEGDGNVAVGWQALFSSTGNHNIAFGHQAGRIVTSGSDNIILGRGTTVGGITTGSDNILIGREVRAGLDATGSNQLNIGNLIFGTGISSGTTISTGNIGIGQSSPSYKLDVSGAGRFTGLVDASHFVATSSSATTTLAGGLNVGSGGLVYDHSTGNVGIGTTEPEAKLAINRAYSISGLVGVTANPQLILTNTQNYGYPTGMLFQAPLVNGGALANNAAIWSAWQSDNHAFLAFATNGAGTLAERMRINASGNVGIGLANPASRLSVSGGASIGSGYAASAAPSNGLIVEGNVGIGTTDPQAKLQVIGAAGAAALRLHQGTDSSAGGIFLQNSSAGMSFRAWMDSGASPTTHFSRASSDPFMSFGSGGNVGIRITDPGAPLEAQLDTSTVAIDAIGTTARFHNSKGNFRSAFLDIITRRSGTAANRFAGLDVFDDDGATPRALVLQQNGGNVGIGTTSPFAKLSVTGGGTGTGKAFQITDSANTPRFTVQDNGNVGIGDTTPAALLTVGNGDLFQVNSSGAIAASTGLTVSGTSTVSGTTTLATNVGNVGIGIATPDTKLQVHGQGNKFNIVASTDNLGGNQFIGYGFAGITTSGGTDPVINEGIVVERTGTWSEGKMHFLSGSGSGDVSLSDSKMTLTRHGKLGLGTTEPGATVASDFSTHDTSRFMEIRAAHGLHDAGMFLTISDIEGLYLWADGNANHSYIDSRFNNDNADIFVRTKTAGTPVNALTIKGSGDIGVGTTSPTAQLHTTGTVRFSNFGAGTLETDASGNVSVSSDETLKEAIEPFARSLEEIMQIDPITFRWKEDSGMDRSRTYSGFSAQNVQVAIPEAVGTNPDGTLTLSERPILATIVNAIKELAAKVHSLAEKLNRMADEFRTNRLCVGDTCINEAQLAALLASQDRGGVSGPSTTAEPATGHGAASAGLNSEDTTPPDVALRASKASGEGAPPVTGSTSSPQVTVPGNDPARVEIGATYSDLGATAKDWHGNDLTVHVYLDGQEVDDVEISTTEPGEHTITYRAEDGDGRTAEAARRIIVYDPADLFAAPDEDVATSSPTAANDPDTTQVATGHGNATTSPAANDNTPAAATTTGISTAAAGQ